MSFNIKNCPSDCLCDIIVSFRQLGMNKDIHIEAMKELCSRRKDGDLFKFEECIEEKLRELPSLDLNINSKNAILSDLLKQAIQNEE